MTRVRTRYAIRLESGLFLGDHAGTSRYASTSMPLYSIEVARALAKLHQGEVVIITWNQAENAWEVTPVK